MESLGQFLKREREFRGMTLEDLSRSTKINVRFLSALEGDRWNDLPRGAFVRGFLKNFATHLQIPMDEVLNRYQAERPKREREEDPFQKFRGFEVKNRFFVFLIFAIIIIILAAYLSSR